MIHHGDCLEVMAMMPDASVDAIVTDPLYGLGFMGKAWDHGAPSMPFWAEMLRVAKPSAYLLSFGGTRTVHRIATSIEDAGWIIRDMLVWAYASGFPKGRANLKPAWEPIVMARKPGPLRHLAIDECRIPTSADDPANGRVWVSQSSAFRDGTAGFVTSNQPGDRNQVDVSQGRWPANVILTDPIFDGGVEGVVGRGEQDSGPAHVNRDSGQRPSEFRMGSQERSLPGGSGTYSRFFLIPKADRSDREPVIGGQLAEVERPNGNKWTDQDYRTEWVDGADRSKSVIRKRTNVHPTVKPTELMRHLVRLVTPPGGTVLDPFLGSGTTAIAAEMEGFEWIGIEKEAEYVAIAEARLNGTQRGLGLDVA